MAMNVLAVDVEGTVGSHRVRVSFEASDTPLLLVGPNGAGKTSLLLMILGALRPDRGKVLLGGEPLFDALAAVNLPVEERRIGFLPQRYGLFPHMSVLENVAYGVPLRGNPARLASARQHLVDLGVAALASRRPADLSGGEAQRVALARALASRPAALLLDEPLAALDVPRRQEVRAFLVATLAARRLPTVIVTHDRADAEAFGSRVLVMESGKVAQSGTLAELARDPATPFIRQFMGG
jgi:molybdate transport system ATP-binding protein